jgi:hypothetical protein
VQEIIERHYNWIKRCWTPNRENYIGLSELYGEHEDFRIYYENYHPKMVEFLSLAMKIFAEKKLS